MLLRLIPRHRSRAALLAALVLASLMSTLLVAARVFHTRRFTYVFLVYNLALARVPLGFPFAADAFEGMVARRMGVLASWMFAASAIGASAFGIYLGRFRRWHSWDIVGDPTALFYDVTRTLLHPSANAHAIAYCLVLASFLFAAYVVVHTWTGSREQN